ncbi:MAG TPA: DNA repair protein RecO [Candidatus Saccharimonadales bacterium]|nr:DNA repair protein RecO [Candidatus Saccharimonadales bacterium]
MKQINTEGIVLNRTDYGEADRIITLLTPTFGKVRLIARAVRGPKSKLAGGIELFSVSEITFIEGRGEIGTLISSRLKQHFGKIVNEIERVQLGYQLIKLLNRTTEDHTEPAYFELLEQTFLALDNSIIKAELIRLWFVAQLLKIAGHSPNLKTDNKDKPLEASHNYNFDFDAMALAPHSSGRYNQHHIKILRLMFSRNTVKSINKIQRLDGPLIDCAPLFQTLLQTYITP